MKKVKIRIVRADRQFACQDGEYYLSQANDDVPEDKTETKKSTNASISVPNWLISKCSTWLCNLVTEVKKNIMFDGNNKCRKTLTCYSILILVKTKSIMLFIHIKFS